MVRKRRSPDEHLPSIFKAWLTKGPMISLIFAGAFYSAGLVLFSFSSKQVSSILPKDIVSIRLTDMISDRIS